MGANENILVNKIIHIYENENENKKEFISKFCVFNSNYKIFILQNLAKLGYDVNKIVANAVGRPYIRSIDLSSGSSGYYYYSSELYNSIMNIDLLN